MVIHISLRHSSVVPLAKSAKQSKNAVCACIKNSRHFHQTYNFTSIHSHAKKLYFHMIEVVDTALNMKLNWSSAHFCRISTREKGVAYSEHTAFLLCLAKVCMIFWGMYWYGDLCKVTRTTWSTFQHLGVTMSVFNRTLLWEVVLVRAMSLIWSQLKFGQTTCGRNQFKFCHYYCYYNLRLRPVCEAGSRKLRPNLAPIPCVLIFGKEICSQRCEMWN